MSVIPADVAVGLDRVRKTYGGDQPVVALDDVSAVFTRGTATAVMGPSGSGKSTLLHCAAGLDRPDSGTVRIGATDLSSMSEEQLTELRRSRVGYAVLAAANTLAMAALARTRELALLRLVGVTRRQVKRMVHAEQAGLLGVALVIGGAIAAVTLTPVVNAVAGQRVPHVPAAGWAAVVGGTVTLALVATVLPVGRLLRTPPVEGIGIRE